MFHVLGYVIGLGNHVAALVDEKGVGREVPKLLQQIGTHNVE